MEVQKFINKDHPLREYVEAIEKLKTMASEINSLPVFVPMHFFLLDCSGFNQVCDLHMVIIKNSLSIENYLSIKFT